MKHETNIELYNIDEINDTDYLWKFLSIEKFFSIVLNKHLYFTRIDGFEDTLEGINPELLLLNHKKLGVLKSPVFRQLEQFHMVDLFPKQTDELIDKLRETQKFNFANCWFLSKKNIESVAMWNLYSHPNSVALNIRLTDFYENIKTHGYNSQMNLEHFVLGSIKYIDYQNSQEIEELKNEIKYTPFIKDKSFIHENEFRIIAEIEKYEQQPFKPKEGISKYFQEEYYKKVSQIYGFNISLNNFFDYSFEIVFHPKISDWVKKDIITILDKFEVPFKTRESKLKLK